MTKVWKRTPALAVGLILFGGLFPLGLNWAILGRVPSASPREALAALAAEASTATLVDVRDPRRFQEGHVKGAVIWPIPPDATTVMLPPELRGRTLYLICDAGLRSAQAVARVRALTAFPVYSVRGGLQAWWSAQGSGSGGRYCALCSESGAVSGAPFRPTPPWEQALAFTHAFILKPMYTLTALALGILLWRRREEDLVALKWGLLAFFLGEEACAANFVFFKDGSTLLEYLHDYGMVLCFGFCSYAFIVGLDSRVVKYSDPAARCALLGVCRTCIKHAPVPCGLERSFYLFLPTSLILAAMPFFAALDPVAYTTKILGRTIALSHPVIHQLYESRVCAAAAFLFLGASLAVFCLKRTDRVRWAELLLAAGLGPLGFSLFRLVLFWSYRENIGRFNLWEEVTEFLFVAAVAAILWIFRRGLLPEMRRPQPAEEGFEEEQVLS